MLIDTSLQRNGKQTMSAYGLLDNLVYVYDGNQIKKITNDMLQAFLYSGYRYVDAANTGTEFDYDANGNMTRFADKRITAISYNLLNMPEEISMLDNNHISYCYDTEGNKLHVRYKTSEYQLAYPGFPLAQEAGDGTEGISEVIPDIPTVIPLDSLIVGPIGGDVVALETSYLTDDYCRNIV
jgi:YD repeat-containing protein